jgi:hypothetical protein
MGLLLALLLTPILLMLVALFGYFMGVILTYTPLVNELLATELLDAPTILAWLFVGSFVWNLFAPRASDKE